MSDLPMSSREKRQTAWVEIPNYKSFLKKNGLGLIVRHSIKLALFVVVGRQTEEPIEK